MTLSGSQRQPRWLLLRPCSVRRRRSRDEKRLCNENEMMYCVERRLFDENSRRCCNDRNYCDNRRQ
jgi:hypothetical protein